MIGWRLTIRSHGSWRYWNNRSASLSRLAAGTLAIFSRAHFARNITTTTNTLHNHNTLFKTPKKIIKLSNKLHHLLQKPSTYDLTNTTQNNNHKTHK
jgi:hypothetical protein